MIISFDSVKNTLNTKKYLLLLLIVFFIHNDDLTALPQVGTPINKFNNQVEENKNKISAGENFNMSDDEIFALVEKLSKDLDGVNVNKTNEILKCVKQTARIWKDDKEGFIKFCQDNFITDNNEKELLFDRLSNVFEVINGNFNQISLDLKKPTQLDSPKLTYNKKVDDILAGYEPSAHLYRDLFDNKIAMIVTLNFPIYTLEEKEELAKNWTKRDWAKARLAEKFSLDVDPTLYANGSKAQTDADNYIANYYIYVGNLISKKGGKLFPSDLKLISHWNLRDEIKSNYPRVNGIEKQELLYDLMTKIIKQEVPQKIINNKDYSWDLYNNKLYLNSDLVTAKDDLQTEGNTRYEHLLNNFKAMKLLDSVSESNAIERKFNAEYEISQKKMEEIFVSLLSSKEVQLTAKLIKKRLARELKPFDIWYDGFKSRSNINEDELSKITKDKYKTVSDFQGDLSNILQKLGFDKEQSNFVANKVTVEPSKGAGHAWGTQAKWQNSFLRTHFKDDGMDYKGFNIAIHEFGHNVEQTFSLHSVPEYLISGVPNNAFTEAIAFLFQLKDLQVLGIENLDSTSQYLYTLDNFWSTYEIMGAALTDQYVWKWLYDNPNTNAKELNLAVNKIAKDVWNKYYAPVFNVKDQNILAVYSHSIDYPLYLSFYPLGHIIEFQLDSYIKQKQKENKGEEKSVFGKEVARISAIGRVLPDYWMKEAVGSGISVKALLEATSESVKAMDRIKK